MTKINTFDVIVLGVGAMGSAACYHIARRGARVLGLERFDIPNEQGSSGGETRLIRKCYFEHPDYVPLLHKAYSGWDDLWEQTGERVLFRTGLLSIGRADGSLICGSKRAAVEHAIAHELLDKQAVRERFDAFHVPTGFSAMYEPDGGFLLPDVGIRLFAELATRHGAQLRTGVTVTHWFADSQSVRVRTDRGDYYADKLVITAGAWTSQLIALTIPLRVTRQPLFWIHPPDPFVFRLGNSPCWAIEDDAPDFQGIYYGFPVLPDRTSYKCGLHRPGNVTSPDRLNCDATDADLRMLDPLFERFLPLAAGPVTDSHMCMYTMSPDGHFVIARHTQHDRAVSGCGFSGHGFKFAPVVGSVLADLALTGTCSLPTSFLHMDRF